MDESFTVTKNRKIRSEKNSEQKTKTYHAAVDRSMHKYEANYGKCK